MPVLVLFTGAYVAVKVQRPDATSTSPIDMFIIRNIAAFVQKWKQLRSDLVAIADLFGAQLFTELNYEQEARNCERFKELYGNIPGKIEILLISRYGPGVARDELWP